MKKTILLFAGLVCFIFKNQAQTVTDDDGNVYNTVTIGNQVWLKQNLKTTKYNDNTAIPLVTDSTAWSNLTTSGYCWYDNDQTTYGNIYGALYNWYTVNTGKLCPVGWHVPTDDEWTTLEYYLITNGYNYDGTTTGDKIAKSLAATTGWDSSTYTGAVGNTDYPTYRNKTGFTALPSGFRYVVGSYGYIGVYGYWWSASATNSSAAWVRIMVSDSMNVIRSYPSKKGGRSVRCLWDYAADVKEIGYLKNIIIYPNPANEEVEIDGIQNSTIEIINVQGQIIKTLSISNTKTIIDISKLSRGVYTIKVITDNNIIVKKLIKQ